MDTLSTDQGSICRNVRRVLFTRARRRDNHPKLLSERVISLSGGLIAVCAGWGSTGCEVDTSIVALWAGLMIGTTPVTSSGGEP